MAKPVAGPVLVGMRAVGKTTVAKRLAKRLKLRFVDADQELERELGRPVADVLNSEGEAWFRARELQTLLRLIAETDTVLATGGGAVLHEQVRAALRHRPTVWLKAPLESMVERVGRSGRRPRLVEDAPDLRSEIEILYAQRKDLYAGVAQFTIDTTSQSKDGVVASIAQFWQKLSE